MFTLVKCLFTFSAVCIHFFNHCVFWCRHLTNCRKWSLLMLTSRKMKPNFEAGFFLIASTHFLLTTFLLSLWKNSFFHYWYCNAMMSKWHNINGHFLKYNFPPAFDLLYASKEKIQIHLLATHDLLLSIITVVGKLSK